MSEPTFKITRWHKFLALIGFIPKIGEFKDNGWTTPFSFFLFKCKLHGLVINRRYGYRKYLICPECMKEDLKTEEAIK